MQIKTFDLNSLEGSNGFVVPGVAVDGYLGSSVSGAGDVNGDGLADLVLGAAGANSNFGASYVVYGSRGGFPPSFNLANLNGNNGFVIPGVVAGDLGTSVSAAGDVNGDGIADLVLGAYGTNYNAMTGTAFGASYVLFGTSSGFPPSFNLASLNGSNGFVIPGIAAGGWLGHSVSAAGDVNGDGIADLVLGAPFVNHNATTNLAFGASYVIFGSRGGFPFSFNLANLDGSNGFVIPVVVAGDLGTSVSAAGDVNGDGIADLVLGAPFTNYNSITYTSPGASYVIFGSREGFPQSFNLANLDGSNGFVIPGIVAYGYLGISVNSAGDVNGDGIDDLVLGAPGESGPPINGASYVLFGSRGGFPPSFNLTNLNGSNGFVIPGVAAFGYLGYSVSTAGDINGDGIADLLLGAPTTGVQQGGVSYVLFGSRGGFPSSFNLANLNGSNGFVIPEVATGTLGTSVSTAGDVNGDGLADLILGAPPGSNSGNGTSYVLFGGVASIIFTNNTLTITEGQTIILSNADLNAIGLISFDSLAFIVMEVQGGRFTLVNDSMTNIFNFTPIQLSTYQVQFISDRTNTVAYRVGMMNMTNTQIVLTPIPANITFIHHPPVVINPPIPNTQIAVVGELFNFVYAANSIFNDSDGDPLTYSAQFSDGSSLPNWLQFNVRANQLSFSGIAPDKGSTAVSLAAKDPLNASVSTGFEILAVPGNSTVTNIVNGASAAQIAGGVVGGILGLVAAISAGLGFWRYATHKNTRKGEQFADAIRLALNLKGVDDFDSQAGQQFLGFVHSVQNALKEAGLNTSTMRSLELRQLADDVADGARNKISPSTDCLGRSVITVTDLNDNLQSLVTEVQVLRAGGKQNTI